MRSGKGAIEESEKKHGDTAVTSGAKTKRRQGATAPSEGENHTLRCRNVADYLFKVEEVHIHTQNHRRGTFAESSLHI